MKGTFYIVLYEDGRYYGSFGTLSHLLRYFGISHIAVRDFMSSVKFHCGVFANPAIGERLRLRIETVW
jgi:hypothetical protein